MKSVLISIQPKWCELIANGKKTIEVRKSRPNIETPFKCYIYCTKQRMTKVSCMYSYLHINEPKASLRYGERITTWGNIGDVIVNRTTPYEYVSFGMQGKVIGEFVCDRIYEIKNLGSSFMIGNDIALTNRIARDSCLEFPDLRAYLKDKNGYAWHISELKIYDKPKELGEFSYPCPDKNYDTCFGCKYFYHDETEMCCKKEAVRQPQSWCYVEE